MSVPPLTAQSFPSFERSVRARWAPILMAPIMGSLERLVIGVAVASPHGFHVEMANALERLQCLYGASAPGVIYAISLAEEQLRHDLAHRAMDALTEPKSAISGVTLGEIREAEGQSLEAIGQSWMAGLSSLYRAQTPDDVSLVAEIDGDVEEMRESVYGNPLPGLVLDYVKERRAGFARFFNEDIQQGKKRRFAGRSHEIHIDFAGSRLVANFEPLQPSQIATSVTKIKRRLWDLKVERDRTPVMAGVRLHEMIVHAPGKDDPRFTRRQHEKVHEAIHALEEQADQEELRLRPLTSVYEMGDRILEAEAA